VRRRADAQRDNQITSNVDTTSAASVQRTAARECHDRATGDDGRASGTAAEPRAGVAGDAFGRSTTPEPRAGVAPGRGVPSGARDGATSRSLGARPSTIRGADAGTTDASAAGTPDACASTRLEGDTPARGDDVPAAPRATGSVGVAVAPGGGARSLASASARAADDDGGNGGSFGGASRADVGITVPCAGAARTDACDAAPLGPCSTEGSDDDGIDDDGIDDDGIDDDGIDDDGIDDDDDGIDDDGIDDDGIDDDGIDGPTA
jgi:hypothetical protein